MRDVPCAVRMLYDLGELLCLGPWPGPTFSEYDSALAPSVVGIELQVPSQSGHGDMYTLCRGWINAFTSPLDRDDRAGRFDLYLLPFRSSHVDGRLWSIGVFLRHNIAK